MATAQTPIQASGGPVVLPSSAAPTNGTAAPGGRPLAPHSVEVEQSVLGGLLLDNTQWPGLAELVTAADFYVHEHRLIFGAIGSLIDANKLADVITVYEQLKSLGQDQECGGLAYLNALAQSVPSAARVHDYAAIVREKARHRALLAALADAEAVTHQASDAGAALEQVQRIIAGAAAAAPAVAPELFRVVDMAALADPDDDVAWQWSGYIPAGHVTLLGGHGGAGKSTLALHLAACVAMGAECLGRPTTRTRVLYFSAEDPASLVLHRLRLICRHMGFALDEVATWLQVLDASDLDPVLFAERRVEGVKFGATTPAYRRLGEYLEREGFGFVIVDNASDVFDADEINRPMVRAFIRSLASLERLHDGAVLLLAHVDKLTSRAGKLAGAEAYSGSTAWHNSVRSRLFLLEVEPGLLELQHQKCNLGPKMQALRLEWPAGGVMQVPQTGGFVAAIQSKADMSALLRLIHEYSGRGEFVHTAHNSQRGAGKLFAEEKTYPKGMKPAAVGALLRDAERDGLLVRELYRDANRKPHERWALTPSGFVNIGVAPSAPSTEHGAP